MVFITIIHLIQLNLLFMKWLTLIVMLSLTSINLSCGGGGKDEIIDRTGCRDRTATNYDAAANVNCNSCCTYPKKKGALLFWTSDQWMIPSCGVITIKLSNNEQANITGYYFTAATDCANRFGGYFYVDEGTYTYQVISSMCKIPGGSVTVVGDRCNLARIQ
jgi:hypothetical protein